MLLLCAASSFAQVDGSGGVALKEKLFAEAENELLVAQERFLEYTDRVLDPNSVPSLFQIRALLELKQKYYDARDKMRQFEQEVTLLKTGQQLANKNPTLFVTVFSLFLFLIVVIAGSTLIRRL